ncbi:MAG: DUF4384 domain-containing protein [Treponema sp.]|nr:DUF4384 domain-containing protein [Treponema sp.]
MRKFTLFLITFFSLFSFLYGNSITSEGTGATEAAARADALSNLSFFFYTEVKSTVDASTSFTSKDDAVKKKSQMDKKVLVSTDMPLLGVEIKISDNGQTGKNKSYTASAKMEPEVCIPLYKNEVEKIKAVIEPKLRNLAKAKADRKDSIYVDLAKDYAQYEKHVMVLTAMKAESVPELSKTPEEFSAEYAQFSKNVTSLDKAAAMLVSEIPEALNGIFVYGPQFEGDSASTAFSRVMTQSILGKLGKRAEIEKVRSTYYMQGTYYMVPGSVDAEDMMMSYYLCKNDGSVVAASPLVRIPYSVYGQYNYLPASYNLTQEIAKGNVADPEFGVSVRINGDRKPQTFRSGDALEIEVRATQQCYIYIVGHVYNEKGEVFSYLFPFDIFADGKEQFVKRIPAKDVNKWVVVNPVDDEGEAIAFEVIPPYGEETLQVFALTTNDLEEVLSAIPDYKESDDYAIVRGSPVEVSTKTRGLAVKKAVKKASKVVHKAEGSITYSTHK